jgi:hypothetical protein
MFRIANLIVLVSIGMPLSAQMGMGAGRCCMTGNQPQSTSRAPVASNAVVEISGVVGQVQISGGQGMPYLEVKHDAETTRVFLGPTHYLIAENFNPKAGQGVAVKGYKLTDSVIAIQVTLPQEKRTLKLRDDNGWPLWRGGPWRGGRGRLMGGPPNPPQ